MQLRPTVLLAVSNRAGFLQAYYDRDANQTGVWVPGTSQYELGTQVDIEIAFAEEQIVLHSRGVVRSKRPVDRGNLRAGIGVDFLPSEERTRALLVSFAKGETDLKRRQSRRLPVVMETVVHVGSTQTTEFTENICRDGALITHAQPPGLGTHLSLELKPKGSTASITLQGEVRWRRLDERPAIGVRFLFDQPASLRELTTLIEGLRARLNA